MIQIYKLFNSILRYIDETNDTVKMLGDSVVEVSNQNREMFGVIHTITDCLSKVTDHVAELIDNQNVAAANFDTVQEFIGKTQEKLDSNANAIDFLMGNCNFLVSQNLEKDRRIAELEKAIAEGVSINVLSNMGVKIDLNGTAIENSIEQNFNFKFPIKLLNGEPTPAPVGLFDYQGDGDDEGDDDTSGIECDYKDLCPVCGMEDCEISNSDLDLDDDDDDDDDDGDDDDGDDDAGDAATKKFQFTFETEDQLKDEIRRRLGESVKSFINERLNRPNQ